MKCSEAREQFFDATGTGGVQQELSLHLAGCAECAQAKQSLNETMALLDEWRAPEPSPYFDTRFRARFNELKDQEESHTGWFRLPLWLRKPALGMPVWRPMLAGALVLAMAVGVTVFRGDAGSGQVAINDVQRVPKGTAVGDLQSLDKNQDLFSDFDVLDDFAPGGVSQQPSVSEQL